MIFLLSKLYRFFVNKYFNNFFIRVSKEKIPKVLYSFFYLFFVFSPVLIAYAYYFLIRAISYYYVVPIVFLDFSNTIFTPLYYLYSIEILLWLAFFILIVGDFVYSRIDNDHIITKIFRNLVLFLNLFILILPYTAPVLIILFFYSMSDDVGWALLFAISILVTPFYYISLFEEKTGNKTNSTNGSNLFKGIIALGLYNKAKENRKRRERNRDF